MASELVNRPKRRALTEWTLDRIYELIFTGELEASAALGEDDLTQRLGVSRTTVSAALRQLEVDGLAVVSKGNGKRVVASFDSGDIWELYTIRAALEQLGAATAANSIGQAAIANLEAIQAEMERRANPDRDPHRRDFEVDFDFHRAVVRASGISRLEGSLTPIWNQTHALLRHAYSLGVYGDLEEDAAAYRDHHEILHALRSGDSEAAGKAMHTHLTARRDQLLRGVNSLSLRPPETSTALEEE